MGDAEPEIITLSAAPGWWLLPPRRRDDGPWRRMPIACWALVADAQGAPFVAAMVVGMDGQALVFARSGRLTHESEWPRCSCTRPQLEIFDVHWCTRCTGMAGERT